MTKIYDELRAKAGVVFDGVLDVGAITTGSPGTPYDLTGVSVLTARLGNDVTFTSWGAVGQTFDGASYPNKLLLIVAQAGSGKISLGSGFSGGGIIPVGSAALVWNDPYATSPSWRVLALQDLSAYALTAALGTAAFLNVAASGNASSSQVVKGNDTRLKPRSMQVNISRALGTIQPGDYATLPALQANETATGWIITGDVAGSISVDIRVSSAYNVRPTSGDSIIGNALYNILLTSQSANEVLTLPAWVTAAMAVGHRVEFYVVSASLVSSVQIMLLLA